MDTSKRYYIIRPTEKRDRFALACYILNGRKKEHQELSDQISKQVQSINSQYREKTITKLEAETLLSDIIQKEYKKLNLKNVVLKNSVISETNQKVFNKFWDKIYTVRYLSDEKSPKHDILKALKLIEPLSIQTASVSELQNKLKSSGATVPQIRRASDRLNQLLRFLNRDIKLNKPKAQYKKVQYITYTDFKKVLVQIKEREMKDFALTLFSTGLRLSEALALTEDDIIDENFVNVNKQITKSGETKAPKREKVGKVVILPFGKQAVKDFSKIEDKEQFRSKFYNILIEACRAVFPKDKTKWVGPHDLRHSHAIYLLSKGSSLTQVALNLRNRVDVCQMYYTGFEHTDATLEGLKKLIS